MNGDEQQSSESIPERVYQAAVRLLMKYDADEYEVRSWVMGSEIANDIGLDKDVVLEALTELGAGRLYVNDVGNGHDAEVIGVDHRSHQP